MAARPATPIRSLPLRQQMAYPLTLDFITPLSLQTRLDADTRLYHLKGHVSETIESVANRATDKVPTEFGELRRSSNNRDVTEIEFGSEDPFDPAARSFEYATQEEMWEDIRNHFPVADMVTGRRGTLHGVPAPLDDRPSLDDAVDVAHAQKAHGNRVRKLQSQLGVKLQNPYQIVKALLLENGDLNPTEQAEFAKRAKSTLATEYLLADNGNGYQRLRDDGVFADLERQLRAGRYWKDIANPKDVQMHANGTRLDGRLYELEYNNGLIGI